MRSFLFLLIIPFLILSCDKSSSSDDMTNDEANDEENIQDTQNLQLDPSFSDEGIFRYENFYPSTSTISKLQFDNQGRLYASLISRIMTRLLPNGGLDLSYGDMGIVMPQSSTYALFKEFVVNEDYSLVGVGFPRIRLAKLTPNGYYDGSFGVNGVADHGDDRGNLNAIAALSSGGYIVGGRAENNGIEKVTIRKTLPNGQRDFTYSDQTVFGESSVSRTFETASGRIYYNLRKNGAQSSTSGILITNPIGTPIFNVPPDSNQTSNVFALGYYSHPDEEGNIFVLSYNDNTGESKLTKYNNNGIVQFEVGRRVGNIWRILIDSEQRIIIASGGIGFAVQRFLPSGELDTTFGVDGYAEYYFQDEISSEVKDVNLYNDQLYISGNLSGYPFVARFLEIE